MVATMTILLSWSLRPSVKQTMSFLWFGQRLCHGNDEHNADLFASPNSHYL